jgi:excisionase family DNA binding protein
MAPKQSSQEVAQHWLTFTQICQRLNLTEKQVLKLIKSGKLVGIHHSGPAGAYKDGWIYLDPTPKYARALEVQALILSRNYSIDVTTVPLLSTAEVAAITQTGQDNIRQMIYKRKLRPTRVGNLSLFTAQQVRDLLWKREKSERRDRRARTGQMVKWFLSQHESEQSQKMSKSEVAKDNEMERLLRKIVKLQEPERTKSLKEFLSRSGLAKEVADILKTTKPTT